MTDNNELYTICFTGHRDLTERQALAAQVLLAEELTALQGLYGDNLRALSGMAKGVDQIAASICIDKNILWAACIPHSKYPEVYGLLGDEWDYLLERADATVYIVNDSVEWRPAFNFVRNEKMIKWSQLTVACTYWDVEREITKTARPRGGTAHHLQVCIRRHSPYKVLQLEKEE